MRALLMGKSWGIFKSFDNGKTFSQFAQLPGQPGSFSTEPTAHCGVYLGNDVVLVGAGMFSATPRVYRSTDRGKSWSNVSLPTTQYAHGASGSEVRSLAYLGNNVVVAGGADNGVPRLWRSTNGGASWVENTNSLPMWNPALTLSVAKVVRVGEGIGYLGMQGIKRGDNPWRYTTDYGVSWKTPVMTDAVLPGGAINRFDVVGMGVADNGNVASLVHVVWASSSGTPTLAGYNSNESMEIWTAEPDGCAGVRGPCVEVSSDNVVEVEVIGDKVCTTVLRRRFAECVDEITDADIISAKWRAGDRLIINQLVFELDVDFTTSKFTKFLLYRYTDSIKKYGLRPPLIIQASGLQTINCGQQIADARALEIGVRFAEPPAVLELEAFYRRHTWEPGDLICVTSAFVPNLVTGKLGITRELFEIASLQPKFGIAGRLSMILVDVEALTLPAPPVRINFEMDSDAETIARTAEDGGGLPASQAGLLLPMGA